MRSILPEGIARILSFTRYTMRERFSFSVR
jgi:hypothetical protein